MPGVSSSQNAPNSSNEVINNANDQPRKVIQDSADYMDLLEKAHINPCMTKCGKCDSCVVKLGDSINHATSSSILCQLKTENSEGGMRNSPPAIFPTNIKVKRTVIFTTVNPFPKIPDAPMLLSRRERTAANRRARQRVVPSAPPLENEDDETVQ
ncbi:hypothetical protein CRE_07209 [Caenorhabditis remanei]|uniref:Uncharacterized protein n=1 Tax=Caenorhabditis remanei TaxID=31234 RepID=E3M2T7_CAERE|nr:hypothetical protein CRE_07209 [Caenorhabditis remanei]